MANADTPEDALAARNNGAEGIGLCRTEHMVFFFFLNLLEEGKKDNVVIVSLTHGCISVLCI